MQYLSIGKYFREFFRIRHFGWFYLLIFLHVLELYCQENYEVKSITFEGNHVFSTNDLLDQMSVHSVGFLKKHIFRKKPFFYSDEIVKSELKRLISFYQTEGFLSVNIMERKTEIDNEKRTLKLIIHIEEGDPVIVKHVVAAFDSVSYGQIKELQNIFLDCTSDLDLTESKRFRDQLLENDRIRIFEKYSNLGFPYVEIDPELNVRMISSEVSIVWHINSGPKCYFGEVELHGNKEVPSHIIFNELAFERNQIYCQNLLDKTQQQIFSLGLFQVASVKAQLTSQRDSLIPVFINIKEAPRFTIKFGVGYGREDNFRAFSNLRRLGFFGGTRRLDLLFKHSGLEPYNIDLRITQPVFLSHRTALTFNPFFRKENEPGYKVKRIGGRTSILHQFSSHFKGSFTYIYERVSQDTSEIDPKLREIKEIDDLYDKAGPIIGLTWDNSYPLFYPSSGYFFAVTLKTNGLLARISFRYTRLLIDIRRYGSFLGGVLAYRLKFGGIESFSQDKFIPVEDRFYAGGTTSVRGWARQQLGPKDASGKPEGGRSLLEGSIELRRPIFWKLTGAFFLDFGNVWRESYYYPLNELRYAMGFGVGINTPIGPARVDIGWPVFDKDRKAQIHLNIGHSF